MANNIEINLSTTIKKLEKKLSIYEKKQLPFAISLALTSVAKSIKKEETLNFGKVFDRPTPFTMNAVGVIPARKDNLTAKVFVKDKQAIYLNPYEVGGKQVPHKEAMLTPKDMMLLNQYGNLPRNKIANLKSQKSVFVGTVKGVAGVWKRTNTVVANAVDFSIRAGKYVRRGAERVKGLKLLVRFSNPVQVKQKLHYQKLATDVAKSKFSLELKNALKYALATVK